MCTWERQCQYRGPLLLAGLSSPSARRPMRTRAGRAWSALYGRESRFNMPALTTLVAYYSANFERSVAWDRLKADEQFNLMHNIRDELYTTDSLQPDGVSRYTTSSPLYACLNWIWSQGRKQRDAGAEFEAACYTPPPPRYDREILEPLVREYSKNYSDKPRFNLIVKDSRFKAHYSPSDYWCGNTSSADPERRKNSPLLVSLVSILNSGRLRARQAAGAGAGAGGSTRKGGGKP